VVPAFRAELHLQDQKFGIFERVTRPLSPSDYGRTRTIASVTADVSRPKGIPTVGNSALAHSIPDACSLTCVGRTALYEAIRTGALRAVKRGRRTLILHEDLLRFVQSLPPVAVKSVQQSNDERNDGQAVSNAAASRRALRNRGIAS
jgi:excisionase family DNA binding protein